MPRPERNWLTIALWLVGTTLVYNVVEAAVTITAAVLADSVALLGFGLDSLIETAAAVLVLRRLRAQARASEPELAATERRVHAFVGWTLLLLAAYVSLISVWALSTGDAPAESRIGIVMAALSLTVMPLVSWGKLRAANELGSAALRAEAKETLACSYLSFTLLLGLVANAVAGWWWADPVAAVLMVPWLVREGLEGIRGEGCCDWSSAVEATVEREELDVPAGEQEVLPRGSTDESLR
jgi:divalent metal cation (Fe/Co/Zn/Cd) transporter